MAASGVNLFAGIDGAPPRSGAKGLRLPRLRADYPPSGTYGITERIKDIGKVMGNLDELARKWQHEDARLRTKPESGKVGAQRARMFEKALLLETLLRLRF